MLQERAESNSSPFVFANRNGKSYLVNSIDHLHRAVSAPESNGKRKPIFSSDFVMHSLRHTMLTRLGESGVDAFTIMRIAGHSSIVVSQRYIRPTQRRWSVHLNGCNFPPKWSPSSRNDSYPLQYQLHSPRMLA